MNQKIKPSQPKLCITFSIVIFLSITLVMGQSKTVVVESKYTCYKDKLSGLLESKKRLNPLWDELVKERMLIHHSDWWEKDDKDVTYEVYSVAESQQKYDLAMKEFTKKANEKFPEDVRIFSEACYKRKDTTKYEGILFPVIKGDFGAGVMVVDQIDERPDPTLNYNIVFDFTAFPEVSKKEGKVDSVQMNWGFSDVGRIYNLHAAAGVPKGKINFVLAVHGFPIFSFLKNEEYQKKYKTDNPNLAIIEELSQAGVRFLVCGQAMHWMGVKKEQLIPQAKVTLSAKTTISSHQAKGYSLSAMKND